MGRRCRRRYFKYERLPIFMLAFGLGLILALLGSVRLALLFAAIALIYLGGSIYFS